MFPIARRFIFDVLTLLTDPGAMWGPRWRNAALGDRERAEQFTREVSQFRAVGAILAEPSAFPDTDDYIRRNFGYLDELSGPNTLVLSPVPPPIEFELSLQQRDYYATYQKMIRDSDRRASFNGNSAALRESRLFESSFRNALGLRDVEGPGIVAAPSFASSAYVWIPIDPRNRGGAFETMRTLAKEGLTGIGEHVMTMPTGESIGAAMLGVIAHGIRGEARAAARHNPGEKPVLRDIEAAAHLEFDRTAFNLERLLAQLKPDDPPEAADYIWRLLEQVANLRALHIDSPNSNPIACADGSIRRELHPLALAALEAAETLLDRAPRRVAEWRGNKSIQPFIEDHALVVVGLARCVEIEINHSLLQWRRQERLIQMPEWFMRYSAAHGPTVERHSNDSRRDVDINRPRRQGSDALLAPSISQLMSLGGAICEPPPKVESERCDDADWRSIRQECSRLIELRNGAAHDQPIDAAVLTRAVASMRKLDELGAWAAFGELRKALSP